MLHLSVDFLFTYDPLTLRLCFTYASSVAVLPQVIPAGPFLYTPGLHVCALAGGLREICSALHQYVMASLNTACSALGICVSRHRVSARTSAAYHDTCASILRLRDCGIGFAMDNGPQPQFAVRFHDGSRALLLQQGLPLVLGVLHRRTVKAIIQWAAAL